MHSGCRWLIASIVLVCSLTCTLRDGKQQWTSTACELAVRECAWLAFCWPYVIVCGISYGMTASSVELLLGYLLVVAWLYCMHRSVPYYCIASTGCLISRYHMIRRDHDACIYNLQLLIQIWRRAANLVSLFDIMSCYIYDYFKLVGRLEKYNQNYVVELWGDTFVEILRSLWSGL